MHAYFPVRFDQGLRSILLKIDPSRYRCFHKSIHITHLIAFIPQKALDSVNSWFSVLVDLTFGILIFVVIAVIKNMLIEVLHLPVVDDFCLLLIEIIVNLTWHDFF